MQLRDRRGDLLHGGRGGHRHRQDVVHEQRGAAPRARQPAEVRLGHGVRAAARWGRRSRSGGSWWRRRRAGSRSRSRLEAEEQGARAGHHERPHDLLGRVGARGDRVRAEDGERLLLGQALARSPGRSRAACRTAPPRTRTTPARAAVVGAEAAGLAVMWPLPEYRKYWACGRSTRTRRSPGRRPRRGSRPPIIRLVLLGGLRAAAAGGLCAASGAREAAQHRGQDTALAVVVDLDRAVQAAHRLEGPVAPASSVAVTAQHLARRQVICEARDGEASRPVRPSDAALSPGRNCSGRTPMPTRLERWIRS